MAYDVSKMADWQVSEAAEQNMPMPEEWQDKLGLTRQEMIPMGRLSKIDFLKVMNRMQDKPDGKYIEVTAITPTPLGEGKSTTSVGLMEGLGKRGKNVGGALRQPSGGPTMNIKGSAAGGGNAILIPMTEFSLGLTGDINDIMNAHNLAMVALTARMQHERNYGPEKIERLSGIPALNIDPNRVEMNWIIDYCAQALRKMVIGLGGRANGYTMESGFNIAVSSECMAILAIAKDLPDLRERLSNITVGFDISGNRVTTGDLQVGGAMTAWMRNTINPTLMCTAEYQPCFVHAGPFANIAVGQSSIIADRMGLKMFDYHVTESGFAADIGFEKFWNVKCRNSGLKPHVSVLTATIRALKMHGGGPRVVPGRPLPEEYTKENLDLLEKGIENMVHMIGVIRKSGMNPVVCINCFPTDTKAEIELVKKKAEEAGARCAPSTHFMDGGDGALEIADAVIDACEEESKFDFLYSMDKPLRERVDTIAREVYGADGADWLPDAEKKLEMLDSDPQFKEYSTMMAKTHLSLSHEPTWKGVPKGWRLPVRDIYIYSGAKFLVPVAGAIPFMPGTSSSPAYTKVDVDTETGKVSGLF
ncbi:MAG: formate--tetrahydrofolate ligase [Desulfosalsimonas sp.]|uniref:formate--tetrahydrofolate ligase n=1 Tax=Desulfosalsimonas sp. TaxID=3073848 RepID=UPI00397045FE